MPPRLHLESPLAAGGEIELPPSASRHVQVLRLQPGAALTLFDGTGGEWSAEVLAMGRKSVTARVLAHHAIERELHTPVTLALGMPANERMDALVEKATELGVAHIVPLVCERSVLRVAGERAERKAAHWQAIAVAACEQSGRNRVPSIALATPLRDWLATQAASPVPTTRLVLS
ncbi:MAG: 16S rRNA (uracil(1498)-N(3))-methyltransferase, partial [Aquabacterium sp.]|nr:16S rRNA (uracil(1498)-N(3))-methyltransferase [Aquabacterium sp.]